MLNHVIITYWNMLLEYMHVMDVILLVPQECIVCKSSQISDLKVLLKHSSALIASNLSNIPNVHKVALVI